MSMAPHEVPVVERVFWPGKMGEGAVCSGAELGSVALDGEYPPTAMSQLITAAFSRAMAENS